MSRNSDPPVTGNSVVDDPELKLPDGTLYEQEFWGISRHELIAGTSEELLGERAKEEARDLLQPLGGGGLASIAGWADRIKRHTPDHENDDQDTIDFLENEDNKDHSTWHFVNLPLDAEKYSRTQYPKFTRPKDVVQTIGACVRVLKGDSQRFSPINALRLLVHLVGDVHQPIHVGCCYLDESGEVARLVRDPAEAEQLNLESDRGGNNIILPVGNNGVSMHSYWDSRLGGSINHIDVNAFGSSTAVSDAAKPNMIATTSLELKRRFVSKLTAMIAQDAGPEPPGASGAFAAPPDRWAIRWANKSLAAARNAYHSLEITGPHGNDDHKYDVSWEGRAAYDARCKPIVAEQLKLATKNLAALLNAIWSEQ